MRKMKDSGIEWIGEIPESWSTQKIKYCFSLIAGATPKSGNSEYWDGDIVWITPADFTTKDMYVKNGHQTITVEGLESCATTIVPIDSIIFSKRAPVGLVAINQVPLCTNQGCISCIPNEGFHSKFYYYAMSVFSEQFDLFASGTTFKEISAEAFANFILPFAKYEDQIRIADYLDRKCAEIDAIIAAKEKTNELLKERRQSIIYEAVTKGLDPTVPMKDSGVEWIGKVPFDWTVCKIKHFVVNEDGVRIGPFGSALTNRLLENGEYNVYSQANLIAGDFASTKHTIDEETFNDLRSYEVLADDICVSMMGTIGKCMVVPNGIKPGIMDSHLIKIRLKSHVNPKFFEYVYDKDNSGLCFAQMKRDSKGTIMDGLNSTIVKNLFFPLPSLDIQNEIVDYLDETCCALDTLITANESTIAKLKEYRQSVIYEAVTGKVEVY